MSDMQRFRSCFSIKYRRALRHLRSLCAALVLLATVIPGHSPGRAGQALFGVNLIANGDAEASAGADTNAHPAPIPGWTTTGNLAVVRYNAPGGFPSLADPGPDTRGTRFFSGGSNDPVSTGSQTIDVTGGSTPIDAGGVRFRLEGYLGGWASQEDNAVLGATFKSAGGDKLGMALIGPVTAADRQNHTGLLLRSTSGSVPPGTHTITIVLRMTRMAGSSNDGYADNLSLILTTAGAGSPATGASPITLMAATYEVPSTIPAGMVEIALDNNAADGALHEASIARLHPGVDRRHVVAALNDLSAQGLARGQSLVTFVGGPGTVPPGAVETSTVALTSGAYILVDTGFPSHARFFTVTSGTSPAVQPRTPAGMAVRFYRQRITMPAHFAAGAIALKVTNSDQGTIHHLLLAKLAAGKTVKDLGDWIQTQQGAPPADIMGGVARLSPHTTSWVRVTLVPGNYAAFCLVADPASGRFHANLGELVGFEVS